MILASALCWGIAGYAQSEALKQNDPAPAVAGQGTTSPSQPKHGPPSPPLPDAPSQSQASPLSKEEEEHILHIVPTVDVSDPHWPVKPLTSSQKFELFTNTAFDRFTFIKAGASAGISQARDTHEGYGQGAQGFGRRYGAAFATQVYNDFFTRFALPSLFHQDPRYFRKGEGATAPRIGYALSRVVVTQGDNGRRQFNFSRVLGNFFTAALANAYYPEEDRTAGRTFARAGRQLASSAVLNVLREFGPQLRRKMFRKKKTAAQLAASKPEKTASDVQFAETRNPVPPPRP